MTGWTEEKIEQLRALWSRGFTASQCAAAIGDGLSRNAVIGKIHRLGIAERGKGEIDRPKKSEKVARQAPTPRPKRAPIVRALPSRPAPEPVAIPITGRVQLVDLKMSQCRWPLGHPGDDNFGFCGQPRAAWAENRMYCAAHELLAYPPKKPRTPKQAAEDRARHRDAIKNGGWFLGNLDGKMRRERAS